MGTEIVLTVQDPITDFVPNNPIVGTTTGECVQIDLYKNGKICRTIFDKEGKWIGLSCIEGTVP